MTTKSPVPKLAAKRRPSCVWSRTSNWAIKKILISRRHFRRLITKVNLILDFRMVLGRLGTLRASPVARSSYHIWRSCNFTKLRGETLRDQSRVHTGASKSLARFFPCSTVSNSHHRIATCIQICQVWQRTSSGSQYSARYRLFKIFNMWATLIWKETPPVRHQ